MHSGTEPSGPQQRLLTMIEKLLELPAADLRTDLNKVTQYIQEILKADKVDAFLYVPAKNLLCARDQRHAARSAPAGA